MPRTANTTSETRSQIAEDYIAGDLTLREIARKFHHTDTTIRDILKEANVPLRHGGERVYDIPALVAAYAAGATLRDLAIKFGGHAQTIRSVLIENGVTVELRRHDNETTQASRERLARSIPELMERYQAGATIETLATDFEVSAWYVRKLLMQHGQTLRAAGPNPKYATMRERCLAVKYGLTDALYEQLLAAQNGACAICGVDAQHTRNANNPALCVDHCHMSGVVRGLLCTACNTGIGYLQDSVETVTRAAAYLTNWPTAANPPQYVRHEARESRGGQGKILVTEAHIPQLTAWVAEGRTVVYMAEQLQVTETTVHKALRRYGLYAKKVTLADRLKPFFPQLQKGVSLDDVAAQLGEKTPTVRAALAAMGVTLTELRANHGA